MLIILGGQRAPWGSEKRKNENDGKEYIMKTKRQK